MNAADGGGFFPADDFSGHLETRLIDWLERRCGITFDQVKRRELRQDLLVRMEALGVPAFRHYVEMLINGDPGGEESRKLINLITINETFFFRVEDHFEILRRVAAPELLQKRERRLRLWSAGCSSGEEVYSIIITLLELDALAGREIDVLGSDINDDMLYMAEKGIYRGRTLNTVSAYILQKYFDPFLDRHKVKATVRARARFRYLNLVEDFSTAFPAPLDVVFFRNVLIYFAPPTIRRIIAAIHRLLAPGGFLFLGPSETLWDISDDFELQFHHNSYVYRKKEAAVVLPPPLEPRPVVKPLPPPLPPPPRPAPAPIVASPRAEKRAVLLEETELMIALGDYARAERLLDELLALDRNDRRAGLLGLILRVNRGDLRQVTEYAAQLSARFPIFPEVHYLLARFWESQAMPQEALAEYRRILFLDPLCLLAREKMLRLLVAGGDTARARLEAGNILEYLQRGKAHELDAVIQEKVQPQALREFCQRVLDDR